jgi:hypothetical protein
VLYTSTRVADVRYLSKVVTMAKYPIGIIRERHNLVPSPFPPYIV